MGAVGVVAEYNPFHTGHMAHLRAIRAALGADVPVVAVLSGDYVQRGEAACFSKFARAEAAVRCGVSLVLELPLPWSLASAEGFARGGVGLLAAAGVVDCISFGSESADLSGLLRCAESTEQPGYAAALRSELAKGISFAAARERAVAAAGGPDAARVLRGPNDLLGVEYIRAARALEYKGQFLPVKREGSPHDGSGAASDIRRRMAEGEAWLSLLPPAAAEVLTAEQAAGRGPVTEESLALPALSRLRMLTEADFALLPDASEGLDHRLFRAVQDALSPGEAASLAKSKRYALSRLRRMVMCAALGIRRGMADGVPPYLRVLAMDDTGKALLGKMRRCASLPVVTKPASVRRMEPRAAEIFELGSRAHDLYVLGYADRYARRAGEDWRFSPHVL